jgi:hypothetical protein
MTSSPYAKVGAKLVDSGFAAIPCRPGSKVPGGFRSGEWFYESEWQRFCNRLPTELETDIWAKWPGAGICVALGFNDVVAVDIDTTDHEVIAAVEGVLPPSPVQKVGSKGYTAFYRGADVKDTKFPINGKNAVEILTHGRQTVVPPTIHPDTGNAYRWLGDALDQHTPASLPELPADIIERLAEALRPFGYKAKPEREHVERTSNGSGGTWREINGAALANLDIWVPDLGVPCEQLRNGNWRCAAVWRGGDGMNVSFDPKGIKDFKTDEGHTPIDVVMLARGVGNGEALDWLKARLGLEEPERVEFIFHKPVKVEPAHRERPTTEAPDVARFEILIELFNLIDEQPEWPESAAQPGAASPLDRITVGKGVNWTNVDGLLGEMRDWILNTSSHPNPRMAVMAAFATLSGVTARHLYTPTGLGLGLILAMLARTTVGKDAPLSAVAKILHAANLGHMAQPATAFTVSGFEQALIDSHGACVATGDEIGENLLAKILSNKATPHEVMMKTFIMSATGQMDSSAPHALTKRSRQSVKGPEPVQTLPGFMFTLLGASTPGKFFESLTSGNVGDGLLGRPLIINADPKSKENKAPFIPVPASVVDALQATRDIGRDESNFSIAPIGWPIYDRQRVQWTPEGEARYDLLGEQIDAVLETEPPYEELYGRIKANSLVLATLHAISRDYAAPMVDAPDVDLGAAMVVESVGTTIAGLGDMRHGLRQDGARH